MLDAAQRATGLTPNKARALLGRFLFSGEEVEKPLDGLSGGERRRLSLAILVQSGANVLILDEPTNHLDLDAREALEDACSPSTAPCSWSRTTAPCSTPWAPARRWRSRTAGCTFYDGGWAEYSRVREERRQAESAARDRTRSERNVARRSGDRRGNGAAASQAPAPSKNALRRLAELEREVERAEAALTAVEDELADPAQWSSPTRSERSTKRHDEAKRAVEQAYAAWEEATRR